MNKSKVKSQNQKMLSAFSHRFEIWDLRFEIWNCFKFEVWSKFEVCDWLINSKGKSENQKVNGIEKVLFGIKWS